jgi:hypothetical protein
MVDTCSIRRAGSASTDQTTGVRTPAYSTLYTGVCRVQQTLPISRPHDSGENFLLLARMDVQLPVSVTGFEVGDEVTVTASVRDPDLVGRTFLIRDLFHKTDATARRMQMTERTDS